MLYPKYENQTKEFDDLILEQFKLKNTARKTGTKKENAFLDFFNNARNMRLKFNEILNPRPKIKKRRLREKVNQIYPFNVSYI
jgi:predicted nucleic acid-binding OB-fold protein